MDTGSLQKKYGDTTQSQSIKPRPETAQSDVFSVNQATLKRVIGLVELATLILNSMIGLRFLLKLMAANPDNAFAQIVYFLTAPFLAVFVGLTRVPSFEGIQIEFFDLIAILVYFLLAWAIVRLLWILFARLRPS